MGDFWVDTPDDMPPYDDMSTWERVEPKVTADVDPVGTDPLVALLASWFEEHLTHEAFTNKSDDELAADLAPVVRAWHDAEVHKREQAADSRGFDRAWNEYRQRNREAWEREHGAEKAEAVRAALDGLIEAHTKRFGPAGSASRMWLREQRAALEQR
jgi:hypothetical protein